MHDSMMIADVGDIVNVSGSRIATPFAPPSPGSTPMSTPRLMPTSISPKFIGVTTTEKPCSRAPISLISVASVQEAQRVERARPERHLEPQLEHGVEQGVDDQRGGDRLRPRVLAKHDHEQRDVDGR